MSLWKVITIIVAWGMLSQNALAVTVPVAACEAAKLKAAGKKANQKLNCYATATAKGKPVDSECLAKAEVVFENAFANAEKKGNCSGDPTEVEAEVDAFVNTVVPLVTAKRAFVSSTTSNGNLGGLAGADSICQSAADAAGLLGAYKAWLSDSATYAGDRLTHATVPYVLVDGTKVADNWSDLAVDGSLDHAINQDEHGASVPPGNFVWTGTVLGGDHSSVCGNWLSAASNIQGLVGVANETGFAWSSAFNQFCNTPTLRLYCIEQ